MLRCLYILQAHHGYIFSKEDLEELAFHHKLKLLCLTSRQTPAPKKDFELDPTKAAKYPLGCAILHGQLRTFQFLFMQVQQVQGYMVTSKTQSFSEELQNEFLTMVRESLDALVLRIMRPKGGKAVQHVAGLAAFQGQCCFGRDLPPESQEISAWGSFVVQSESKTKTDGQKHYILQLACGMWDGLYLSEQLVHWLISQKVDYPPKAEVSDLKVQ